MWGYEDIKVGCAVRFSGEVGVKGGELRGYRR